MTDWVGKLPLVAFAVHILRIGRESLRQDFEATQTRQETSAEISRNNGEVGILFIYARHDKVEECGPLVI